jgi:glycosyltransferase involved in cell wall biosynthesis
LYAYSVGTPAIVYPVGGIPDMIEHGVNGYIVNDLLEARTHIEQAIADPDMYLTLRRTTFQYYTENLSWDIFEQKLITK